MSEASDESNHGEHYRDQDPDLEEDFGDEEWPFSGKGGLDDVPTPTGTACLKISNILGGASEHSGDFSFGGQAEDLPAVPGLFVDGVGPVPVPLWEERAQKLIAKCEKSPFGHNMDTKMDENVRKSWQLAPDQVKFQNPQWQSGIDKMEVMIADRLGYKGIPLKCVLYKLLVYEEGGHFVKHQDTEKEDGMIATLVIQPPSLHEGGDLVVYRDGEVKHRHDFGKADGTATFLPHYAVHYADAEHAVEKVTKGYRLALVYSVCLPSTMRHLERNPNKPMSRELADIIKTMQPGDDTFALLLSHEYTEKSVKKFGSSGQKGLDFAKFCVLLQANALVPQAKKLDFFVVRLEHRISFHSKTDTIGDWEEDGRDETTTWFSEEGEKLGDADQVALKFNFLNPEKKTYSQMWSKPYGSSDLCGYLGNDGPSKDSVYFRVAVVAWPRANTLENFARYINLKTALKTLPNQDTVDSTTLGKLMDIASLKLAESDEIVEKKVKQYQYYSSRNPPVPVSPDLCQTLCKLLERCDDSALANLFFSVFFTRLKMKDSVAVDVARLVTKFGWGRVGQTLLDALESWKWWDPHYKLEATLKIASEFKPGEAQQSVLKLVMKRADEVEEINLCVSKLLEKLWQVVLCGGNDAMLEQLANRFKKMNPGLLQPTMDAFSKRWRDPRVPDAKKLVLVSIVAHRSEWLTSQIRVLEKPFSWMMPAAEFPDAQIEDFLRGGESTMTTKGVRTFHNLQEARDYARKYNAKYNQVQASFKLEVGGSEDEAFVTISKTRDWFDKNQEKLPPLKEELTDLTNTIVDILVPAITRAQERT